MKLGGLTWRGTGLSGASHRNMKVRSYMNAGQSSESTKGSEGSQFPLDIAAVLAPVLLAAVLVYVTCAISWAKAFGDTSLLHLALWLGGFGAALLFVVRIPL